jgi:cell division topological specificity factor MinE
MWENMVQRFFGGRGSKDEAKDRLQIALMFDRLGMSAERMEALRKDILITIARHVQIDPERVEIDFHNDRTRTALFINAPVRRTGPRADGAPASKGSENKAHRRPPQEAL